MNRIKILLVNILTLFFAFTIFSCEDKISTWELIQNVSHNEVGIITMVNNETTNDTLHTLTNVIDGKTISLLAISVKEGWEFSHWEGSFYSEANPHTFLMDGHHEITAVFKLIQYTLSIDIYGEGEVEKELILAKDSNFDYGSQIKLTAVPNKGWEFDRWEGDLSGNVNPETIFIDSTKNIAAFFKLKKYPLAIKINGEGTVDEELLLGKVGDYNHGSQIKLTAVPNKGWEFDRWEGDLSGNVNPETIVLDSSKMVDAFFEKSPYTLEININGGGSITKIPNQDTFYFGDSVTLSALGDTGWKFDRWDGDVSGNVNPLKIFVDSTKSINAIFERIQYSLEMNITGNGSIKKDPNQDTFYYGDTVTLTAIPDAGWNFNHWEGDLTGSLNPEIIIINKDKKINAEFISSEYSINISVIGNGSVDKTPNKELYNYNEIVGLTATADAGWEFDHWEGNLTGSNNSAVLTMDGQKSVTAVFKENNYVTENVIIVVMDGARYSETWGDPNHTHIPYMANYMSDQGVVNTNFYNMEETITTPGHIYMTTGVYQVKEGKSKEYPYYPSIFQYWREETTNTNNKAWVIASKDKLEPLGNCNLDSWKDKYLPNTDCGINGAGTGYRDDSITYTKAINILSTHKPNLVLVNFREPDVSGHSGNWNNYLQGIKVTDRYVYKLWNFINTNVHYKGKTTMFVTNDHGRHLDGVYTGFKDHGCGCDGCRHINFYAYGPDFKEGVVITTGRELIDISATVSELLDFNMPYGKGNVMSELFK